MLILTLRTDKPEAEIGLFNDDEKLTYVTWPAHRQLAETIHAKLKESLESQSLELSDVAGIIVFKGPGSFTGLRIGLSVANALADSLQVPVVGETGEQWIQQGSDQLQKGNNQQIILPKYGSPPHTTQPKH